MEELKNNTKFNIIRTLKCIASKEEQIRYKDAVAFVHIGYELLNQSNQVERLIDTNWFREIWTGEQLEALIYFSKMYRDTINEFSTQMPDVPELFENPIWLNYMTKTKEMLLFF